MNIIVCVKAVPAYAENPTVASDGCSIHVESSSVIINESDEYALEQALLLKKTSGATVIVVTVGSLRSQEVLYRCLAKGANVAVRVDGDETDPNIVSFKLFRAIKKLNYDLILTGVESSDGMSSQAGISLASHLDLPFAYAVTRIESVTDATVVVDRELGGGRQQTLEICKPAVLALQSGTGSLTYPPAVKLVQARRSPIPCWTTADLGITDAELAALRKVRFMAIQPRGSSAAIEWLTGTPEKIADEIVCRIRKAL